LSGSTGLSWESVKALEIFASLQKSPEVGKDVSALITSFIQKIIKQSVQTENKYSFVAKADICPVFLTKNVLSILK